MGQPQWHPGRTAIFAGLCLGFGLWILQLVLDYGLSSFACFPQFKPQAHITKGFGWVWDAAVGISLAALAVALMSAALCFRNWRRSSAQDPASFNDVLEKGEGPIKYLEMWGLLTALAFGAVIVFNTLALFLVPLCKA